MFRTKEHLVATQRAQDYATKPDFCRIFAEDESSLYHLSLLLTADEQKAERCFVAALEDCLQGSRVFKERANSWSRRMVIKNAIQIVNPEAVSKALTVVKPTQWDIPEPLSAVLHLAPMERFVFVMSILEEYSLYECSILLNSTRKEVADAQARAMATLAGARTTVFSIGQAAGRDLTLFLEPIHAA